MWASKKNVQLKLAFIIRKSPLFTWCNLIISVWYAIHFITYKTGLATPKRFPNGLVPMFGVWASFWLWVNNTIHAKPNTHTVPLLQLKGRSPRKLHVSGAHLESCWSPESGDVTAASQGCLMTAFHWQAGQLGCVWSASGPRCCHPETGQSQYRWEEWILKHKLQSR